MRTLFIGGIVTLALLAGCGNDLSRSERPLDSEEASILAEVLWRNHESGGARFKLAARAGVDGGTISLEGAIDWTNHGGQAIVSGGSGTHPVTQVWWSQDTVGERRPSLDAEVSLVEPGATNPVLVRRPDTATRRLDQLIAIVTGLSAKTPENAQLILQLPGSAFLREDVLRGRAALVLRYGRRSVFWLDKESRAMLRFEGSDTTGRFPVVVDFLAFGPQALVPPMSADLLDLETLDGLADVIPASP